MTFDKYDKFNNSLNSDFENIIKDTSKLWKNLKNKNIFLTGCTGFFGYWILRTFVIANKKFKLNSKAYVLTRNKSFKKDKIYKLCNDKSIFFHVGDIRNFKFPKKKFEYIIHGATTSAYETFKNQSPLEKASVIIDGTKNILNFAKKCSCKKFLYLSSGAVYHIKSSSKKKFLETSPLTQIKDDNNVLGRAKRIAELQINLQSNKKYFKTNIARCFSFVGPLLPLNIHYALGNFLKNSISNKSIQIKSDGKSIRSYMYVTDLIVWLFHIFFNGKNSEIYNIGSENKISILNLAKLVKKTLNNKKKISYKKSNLSFIKSTYVPSTLKIRKELKMHQKINLNEAIQKTFNNIKDNRFIYND